MYSLQCYSSSSQKEKKNYRITFIINAFIAVMLGLGFIILPGKILDQFGVDEFASTKLLSPFFGIAIWNLVCCCGLPGMWVS